MDKSTLGKWEPNSNEVEYYSIPSPASGHYTLSTLFPSLLSYVSSDPTWGRASLPRSPHELRIMNDPTMMTRSKIVPLPEGGGKHFLAYDVWEKKDRREREGGEGTGRDKTLIYLHGLNDYAGKFAEHADAFINVSFLPPSLHPPGPSISLE